MAKHANIGNSFRPAPRVTVTGRETPGQMARRGAAMSFPVTVTRVAVTLPGSVAESRDGHIRQGATTQRSQVQRRDWRVVKSATGTFLRAEYRVKGGLVTVRKVKAQGFDGWMGFLTVAGVTVPVAAIARGQAIEPHMIQDETRRTALRNAAQIGHGEL